MGLVEFLVTNYTAVLVTKLESYFTYKLGVNLHL